MTSRLMLSQLAAGQRVIVDGQSATVISVDWPGEGMDAGCTVQLDGPPLSRALRWRTDSSGRAALYGGRVRIYRERTAESMASSVRGWIRDTDVSLHRALRLQASACGWHWQDVARLVRSGMHRARESYRRQGVRPLRSSRDWNAGWLIGLYPDFQ